MLYKWARTEKQGKLRGKDGQGSRGWQLLNASPLIVTPGECLFYESCMRLHFFLPCLFCDPENFFTILARIKESQVFLQWGCSSSSGEIESKLNFVLQVKNISEMQVNKNVSGSSWAASLWDAKQTAAAVKSQAQRLCPRRAGRRGSAREEQGADFAYNLENKGKTRLTPSPPHFSNSGPQCTRELERTFLRLGFVFWAARVPQPAAHCKQKKKKMQSVPLLCLS